MHGNAGLVQPDGTLFIRKTTERFLHNSSDIKEILHNTCRDEQNKFHQKKLQ
jgi:hypothetical protein